MVLWVRHGKSGTHRVWCYGCATGSPVLRWGMEGSSALLFRFCKDVIEPDGTLTQQGSVPLSLSPRCRVSLRLSVFECVLGVF